MHTHARLLHSRTDGRTDGRTDARTHHTTCERDRRITHDRSHWVSWLALYTILTFCFCGPHVRHKDIFALLTRWNLGVPRLIGEKWWRGGERVEKGKGRGESGGLMKRTAAQLPNERAGMVLPGRMLFDMWCGAVRDGVAMCRSLRLSLNPVNLHKGKKM